MQYSSLFVVSLGSWRISSLSNLLNRLQSIKRPQSSPVHQSSPSPIHWSSPVQSSPIQSNPVQSSPVFSNPQRRPYKTSRPDSYQLSSDGDIIRCGDGWKAGKTWQCSSLSSFPSSTATYDLLVTRGLGKSQNILMEGIKYVWSVIFLVHVGGKGR